VNQVRFVLVGCGKIAKKHIAALGDVDGARIVGLVDRDERLAGAVAEQCGVPYASDLASLLTDVETDVVSVLTPSGAHAEAAAIALEAGRHVVVEKPLVLRSDEGRRLVALAEACQRGLFVVHQNRFNRPIVRMREALDAGRFGKLVLGAVRVRWRRTQEYYDQAPWRGTWAADGGVFANQALHHLDMLLWMMGDVESVQAQVSTRLVDVEVDDTAVAILRFRSGALGVLEATTATRPKDLEGSISLLGEGGTIDVGGFAMNQLRTWEFAASQADDEDVREHDAENPSGFAWNHARYLESVAARVREGRTDSDEGREACHVLDVLNALYDSAAAGRAVAPGESLGHSRLGRGESVEPVTTS